MGDKILFSYGVQILLEKRCCAFKFVIRSKTLLVYKVITEREMSAGKAQVHSKIKKYEPLKSSQKVEPCFCVEGFANFLLPRSNANF